MSRAAMRWVGRGVLALATVVLVVNTLNVARNWDRLRPVARGDIAPPFDLPLADGTDVVSLEGLRGNVVLIDFWATWCSPCRESMPAIQRVYERFHNRGLEVVSVNTDEPPNRAKARAFARRYGLTFPIAVDDGYVASLYKVRTIPHLVLVDHRGVVRGIHTGTDRQFERDLSSQVEQLVRQVP